MVWFVIVTALLVVSAGFLADALRRLKKSFSKSNKLVVNEKTMCLHVTALFLHTVVIVIVQYITVYTFINPSSKDDFVLNVSRIVLFASQSISQAIVIYLFVQFSKPQSLMKDQGRTASGSSSGSEEERDVEKLNMLFYIKQMPKMIKQQGTNFLDVDTGKSALE